MVIMRKGMKIAIGVILAIAILACAFFLYRAILGDSNKTVEPSQTPLPIPTLAPAPAVTPSPTTGTEGTVTASPTSTQGTGTVINGE